MAVERERKQCEVVIEPRGLLRKEFWVAQWVNKTIDFDNFTTFIQHWFLLTMTMIVSSTK